MTHRDVEEIIGNLEYLLALNISDARTRERQEQMLQAFRVTLQAADQQRTSLTSTRKHKLNSDLKIALMYAEEELFLAARALISREPVSIAHRHLLHLLEHLLFLPLGIGECLLSLDAIYSRREDTGLTDAAGADALTTATRALLDAVRDELGKRVMTLAA